MYKDKVMNKLNIVSHFLNTKRRKLDKTQFKKHGSQRSHFILKNYLFLIALLKSVSHVFYVVDT